LREGVCRRLNCKVYGCGYSVLNIVCAEGSTEATYSCRCPGSNTATTVTVSSGDTSFGGCEGDTPTVTAVIERIGTDPTLFEVYIETRIPEADSLDLTSRSGNSFVFTLESSVSASTLEAALKREIARFIGNGVTADQVHLTIRTNKKRATSTITATIDEDDDIIDDDDDDYTASAVVFSGLGSLLVAFVVAMF
jgi:hypothetical protein